MSRTSRFLFAAILLVTIAAPSWAQRGLLRGTVVNAEGEPLSGVQVTVTSEQLSSFRQTLQTDEDGEFTVRFLTNQAQYTFEILLEKPGYQSVVQEVSPSAMRQSREEFVLEASETRVVEHHGDLAAVVTGSTNAAIEAFNAGLTAQREGDLGTARDKFQEAVAADATLGPAHVALSQVLLDQKHFAAAVEAADQALALDIGRAEALRVKYQALRALGKKDEAEAVASELESVEDAVATARRLYNEGSEAFQADDLDTALAKFQEAAKLDPSLVDAHHAIATVQLGKGNAEEAAAAAQRALDLGSDDVRTVRVLYDAYQALGRLDELTEIARRLAAVDPDFGGAKLLEQAAGHWNAGQTAQAVSLARQALAIDSSLAKAHYFIGLDHLSKGENAQAKQELQTFIDQAPDDPEAATAKEMLAYIE